jgi:chromosome segregation ATPase
MECENCKKLEEEIRLGHRQEEGLGNSISLLSDAVDMYKRRANHLANQLEGMTRSRDTWKQKYEAFTRAGVLRRLRERIRTLEHVVDNAVTVLEVYEEEMNPKGKLYETLASIFLPWLRKKRKG